MSHILVVDDDPGFRKLLETILLDAGYSIESAATVKEAKSKNAAFHLVLCDLKLPDGHGLEVLDFYRHLPTPPPVILITAFGNVPTAVEAMKLGASDFLQKPLRSPEDLRRIVAHTLQANPLPSTPSATAAAEPGTGTAVCDTLLYRDPTMHRVVELAHKVAPTGAIVLLTGESGTGKDVLAHCIQQHSRRAAAPFVVLNCAALAPSLTESALFGHEKGSFTGAIAQHKGVFERAHKATLFLDEIGELDAPVQAKLLRVLQDGSFERLGGHQPLFADVRLIAATNRDLAAMAREGKFREDLFYRLSTFPIAIPPLRNRPQDVPLFITKFLAQASLQLGRIPPHIDPAAMAALQSYPWPGNVRELKNMMERLAILSGPSLTLADLPLPSASPQSATLWKQIEWQAILDALQAHQGNRTRAAQQLGISLRTLQYRIKEHEPA